MPKFPLKSGPSSDVEDRRHITGKPSPSFDLQGRRLQTPEQKRGELPLTEGPPRLPVLYRDGSYDDAKGNSYESYKQYQEINHMAMPGSQVTADDSGDPTQPGKTLGHRILAGLAAGGRSLTGMQQPWQQGGGGMPPPQPLPSAVAPAQQPMPMTPANPALIRRVPPMTTAPPPMSVVGSPMMPPPALSSGPTGVMTPNPGGDPNMSPRPLIRRPIPGITPAAQNISDEQGVGMPQY